MSDKRQLARFVSGQPLSDLREPLNRMVDEINRSGNTMAAAGASIGYEVGSTSTPVLATNLLQVIIRDINDTSPPHTLGCVLPGQQLNPSAQVWTVQVPPTLDEASRDGVSYVYTDINNRTADSIEVQKLTPIYVINDVLLISQVIGQVVSNGEWRDLNIDGRQWAKVP